MSATAHNYRTQDTPNADPLQFSRNQELLNHEKRNYWDPANERIEQLHLERLRKDAVRCVEILMTASSEGFARDGNKHALEMRGKQWVQGNLHFLEKTFGREDTVSFTLHQDETTPHIHAVIVPVTREQRLHKGQRVGRRSGCRVANCSVPAACDNYKPTMPRPWPPINLNGASSTARPSTRTCGATTGPSR